MAEPSTYRGRGVDAPGPLKYAAIVAIATAVCLGTYELAIRRTRLRRVLG